jgi:hypothetical protein
MQQEAGAKKLSENGLDMFLRKVGILSELHGVTSQKIVLFVQDKLSETIYEVVTSQYEASVLRTLPRHSASDITPAAREGRE